MKQNATTRRVWAYVTQHEHASIREVTAGCGLSSTAQAAYHLLKLERCGYIAQQIGKARARRVLVPLWEGER